MLATKRPRGQRGHTPTRECNVPVIEKNIPQPAKPGQGHSLLNCAQVWCFQIEWGRKSFTNFLIPLPKPKSIAALVHVFWGRNREFDCRHYVLEVESLEEDMLPRVCVCVHVSVVPVDCIDCLLEKTTLRCVCVCALDQPRLSLDRIN